MVHRSPSLVLLAALAAAALACRSGAARPAVRDVSDADFGRLDASQTGPVDDARRDLSLARDEAARAERRVADARPEADFARADQTAARADAERAAAELRVARESGDPRALARAQELAAAADLRRQTADAHLAYAQRLAAAREADLAAARARIALADATVERAKLAALEQAGIPAAARYDPRPLDARAAEAWRAWDQARSRGGQAERASQEALARWRSLYQRYEARAGASRSG